MFNFSSFFICFVLFTCLPFSYGKRFFITRYGACQFCDRRGNNYLWCHVGSNWDYCSVQPGYSTRDKECQTECGFHGQEYLWCYLKEGGWDYCSHIEDTSLLEYTTYGDSCHNYCDLEHNKYVCRGKSDRDDPSECSPAPGVAAHGAGCKSLEIGDGENSCSHHGYNYIWCRTDDGSWGYCSNPGEDSSVFRHGWRKRDVQEDECDESNRMRRLHVSVQQRADGVRLVTGIYMNDPDPTRLRTPSGEQRRDARTVLYRWHAGLSSDARTGGTTEQTNGQIRLDRQGLTQTQNYGQFVNLQLQINGANLRNPTSIAQLNIPETLEGYDARGYRRMIVTGLHYSLYNSASVWIFQQRITRNGNLQCPRRGSG